ncbi:MAG: glycosyl hydrolase family 28-related protein [Nanoarchaeota archaeon]
MDKKKRKVSLKHSKSNRRINTLIIFIIAILLVLILTGVLIYKGNSTETVAGEATRVGQVPQPSVPAQPITETTPALVPSHLHELKDLKQKDCLQSQYISYENGQFICKNLLSINLNNNTNNKIYVNILDYGAVPNDNKDDWAAIQKALDELKQNTGSGNYVIFMPAGTYQISDTLQPPNSASYYTLMGEGKMATQIRWFGSKGKPMIKLLNARGTVLRDFGLFGNGGAIPSYGIEVHIDKTKIGGGAPTGTFFENLLIANYYGEVFDVGIGFTSGPEYDANNEGGTFINVDILNANKYGYSFEHSNSLNHNIYSGVVTAKEAAINNINPNPVPWNPENLQFGTMGGSFAVFGTLMNVKSGGHIFRLGAAHHSIMIFGASVETENGSGLLTTPIPITEMPTTIQFIGGTYKLGGGNIPNVYFDAGVGSILSFTDVTLAGEGNWEFPSSGSKVIINGGVYSIVDLKYNNEVLIDGSYNSAGALGFNPLNLGGGKLKITDSSGGFDGLGWFGRQRFDVGDQTPSVQGWDYFEAYYTTLTTITDFKDGYPGKEFTLFVPNGNLIIKSGAIRTKDLKDLSVPAGSFIHFRKASPSVGGPFWWIENI